MLYHLLAAAVMAVSTGEMPPPPVDDEARIEELFANELALRESSARRAEDEKAARDAEAEAAPAQFPPPSGGAVAFEDLGKLVGYPIRVRIGAHSRAGWVEKVAKDAVTLKAPMGGGYAQFTLNKRQITSIEMQ